MNVVLKDAEKLRSFTDSFSDELVPSRVFPFFKVRPQVVSTELERADLTTGRGL